MEKKHSPLEYISRKKRLRESHSESGREEMSSKGRKKKRRERKAKSKHKKKKELYSNSSDSDCSSSTSTTSFDERERRKRKKAKKKKHKSNASRKSVSDEVIIGPLPPSRESGKKESKDLRESDDDDGIIGPLPISSSVKGNVKSMAPMSKEEWEKSQSIVKRVFDEETGRWRLVKGDGEILEEIVSRDRHKEINRQSTTGDGYYFQSKITEKIKFS